MFGSSSTMVIRCFLLMCSGGYEDPQLRMAGLKTRCYEPRKDHAEAGAAERALDERDVAAHSQCVLLRDRQPQPHSVLLERDRRLEERSRGFFAKTGTRVVHFHDDL